MTTQVLDDWKLAQDNRENLAHSSGLQSPLTIRLFSIEVGQSPAAEARV